MSIALSLKFFAFDLFDFASLDVVILVTFLQKDTNEFRIYVDIETGLNCRHLGCHLPVSLFIQYERDEVKERDRYFRPLLEYMIIWCKIQVIINALSYHFFFLICQFYFSLEAKLYFSIHNIIYSRTTPKRRFFSPSMASKPIIIRWIRTVFRPYWNHA